MDYEEESANIIAAQDLSSEAEYRQAEIDGEAWMRKKNEIDSYFRKKAGDYKCILRKGIGKWELLTAIREAAKHAKESSK